MNREEMYRELNKLEADEIGYIMNGEYKTKKDEYNEILNKISEQKIKLYGSDDENEIMKKRLGDLLRYGY